MAIATSSPPSAQPTQRGDQRFLLHDIPWWMYVALRDATDEGGGLKLTYLAGALELMSPSALHEDAKTIIARLIEVWAMEGDFDLRGFGGTTFRREAKQRGLEPDECYKLGPLHEDAVPDVAIEVVVTNPRLDKLSVYAGLGVPEVWVWRPQPSAFEVYRLVGDQYEARTQSELLPTLDLAQLCEFVRPGENQTQLAKAYQAKLRDA